MVAFILQYVCFSVGHGPQVRTQVRWIQTFPAVDAIIGAQSEAGGLRGEARVSSLRFSFTRTAPASQFLRQHPYRVPQLQFHIGKQTRVRHDRRQ